jgi:hypothetical protein
VRARVLAARSAVAMCVLSLVDPASTAPDKSGATSGEHVGTWEYVPPSNPGRVTIWKLANGHLSVQWITTPRDGGATAAGAWEATCEGSRRHWRILYSTDPKAVEARSQKSSSLTAIRSGSGSWGRTGSAARKARPPDQVGSRGGPDSKTDRSNVAAPALSKEVDHEARGANRQRDSASRRSRHGDREGEEGERDESGADRPRRPCEPRP